MSSENDCSDRRTRCRKECGGGMRPICVISNLCRLAVIPAVWWGIFGFGGASGFEMLQERWGFGFMAAASITALLLAIVSTAALLPCGIHRRILRRRAARQSES